MFPSDMATRPMSQPTEARPGEWTYSEYARLPEDGNRYEVLDGELLVTPAPTPLHQQVIFRLQMLLFRHVQERGEGWVFQNVDLLFATGHFLRPDLIVVPKGGRDGITDRGVEVPPALVVEVLSPSSRTIDRVSKPRRYLDFGVPAYWVVDPAEGAVWMWDRSTGPDAPLREEVKVRWSYPEGTAPLEFDVAALVAPI
jgi:Uma2 family endonuclease